MGRIHKALGALASLVTLCGVLGAASLGSSGANFAAVSIFQITNFVPSASAGEVAARDQELQPGEAYVTRFSGTSNKAGQTVIDTAGTVGSIIDLRAPVQAPRGQHWINEPQSHPATAGELGQVFGIALDDANPPNVYLTATAAFGLHRTADNAGWMPGMWGPNAGPGAVWKLDASKDYAPSLFATVKLGDRDNTSAALGNITFDGKHKQLFVSDLETGMIHRLSLDGRDLGHFDHGADGRKAFIDASTNAQSSLPPVAFDPNSSAKISNCPAGDFSRSPECWNIADFRRRVWGVGVHQDKAGSVRLFYSVWSSEGFGNPDFGSAGEDEKRNTIWSVAIADDGSFDATSVRREFFLPDFFTAPDDIARAGRSRPVSDITFCKCSGQEIMILAERGGMRNLGLDAENPFATPHESRLLRYEPDQNGVWQPKGRYDVGFYDRKNEKEPFIRANSSGGADFDYGYTTEWRIDTQKPDEFVWATGDSLCSGYAPCFAPDTGRFEDGSEVHGIQGIPLIAFDELLPAAALQPYPKSGQPTDPVGPSQSWMVDTDINVANGAAIMDSLSRNDATKIGDIAIYQPCPGTAGVPSGQPNPVTPPPPNTEQPPSTPQPPAPEGPDLSKQKTGPAECVEGQICTYTITITNNGPGTWSGPLWELDTLPPDALLANFDPQPDWICTQTAGTPDVICNHTFVTLQPGEAVTLTIDVLMPLGIAGQTVQNCVADIWLPSTDPNDPGTIASIEEALAGLGYPVGPIDGVLDVDTMAAISQFQADNGLPVTGVPDKALIDLLFPGNAAAAGDADPTNDQSCAQTLITPIGPVLERAQPPAQPQAVAPDLEIKKQQLGRQCVPGGLCSFALILINHGPGKWSGEPVIADTLPTGAAFVSSSAWACAQTNERITCRNPLPVTLAPGASRTILITIRMPQELQGAAQNCGEIDWPKGAPADPNPANDRVCVPIRTAAKPTSDLATLKLQKGACQAGGVCSFELWLVNRGPGPWTGRPELRDELPMGATLQNGTGCQQAGSTVTCAGPEVKLPTETAVHFSITVKMPDHVPPGTKNCVEVERAAGAASDPIPQNDKACIPIKLAETPPPPILPPTAVGPGPDTSIEKVQLGTCHAGGICSFEIKLVNNGPGEWNGKPTISESLLAGSALSQSSPGTWQCTPDGAKLTCSASDSVKLAQGEHLSLVLSLRMGPSLTTGMQNCAELENPASGPADTHPENNRICIPVEVTPTPTYTPHPPQISPPPTEAQPPETPPPPPAQGVVPGCPDGHYHHGHCVPNVHVEHGVTCPAGTIKRGKRCVAIGHAPACPHGTQRRGNICVPIRASCPGGTVPIGNNCVPLAPYIHMIPQLIPPGGGGGGGEHHHHH